MPKIITQRADLRKQRQRVELDGLFFEIALTWRTRPKAWYMDLYDQDGQPVALGRRLSPGWAPLRGVSDRGVPDGSFIVKGLRDYSRTDLGDTLLLVYYTEDELDQIEIESPEAPTVEIV